MNAPRRDVLERNLVRLFGRAYLPARPAPEFVARLEQRLAPWIAPPVARRRAHPLLLVAAGLAAAAVLLPYWWPRGAPQRATRAEGLAEILASGAGAVRVEREGEPWYALAPDGRLPSPGPAEAWASGAGLELAAPVTSAARWRAEGAAQFELGPGTLLVARGDATRGVELELRRGALRFELDPTGGLAAKARDLAVRLAPGARGELALAPPPAALGAPRPSEGDAAWPRLALAAGGGMASTPREATRLTAPVELWVREGRFVRTEGDDPDAAVDSTTERTPLAASTPASAAVSSVPAGSASLVIQVRLPLDSPPPAELRVVLLRAVPLPAVAWPMSRAFDLGAETSTLRWADLQPGTYLVQVLAEGLAPAARRGVVLTDGEQHRLDLELAAGARVFGHVVDARTGAPLVGALVVSETDAPLQILGVDPQELPAELRAWTLTAPDGGFELPDLSPGAHRLRASHPEHAPRWLDVPELGSGEELGGLLLELGQGGALEGRVERADGSPKFGAELIASHVSGADGRGLMTYSGALTDAEGRYRIPRLAPGSYVVLDVGSPSAADPRDLRPRFAFAAVREGEVARVDFLAPAGGPVFAGSLLDGEGRPLARGVVQLVPRRGGTHWAGEQEMISSAIEADGSFALSGLEPGAYAVYAGGGDATVLRDLVELRSGERLERTYRLGGQALEGRATCAEEGRPLERVVIVVRSAEPFPIESGQTTTLGELIAAKAWTAADGRFRIDALPAGRYELLALEEGGARALTLARELVLPGPSLELRLPLAGELELDLRDGAGAPLAGVRVVLVDPTGLAFGDWVELVSDGRGAARARRLAPGRWTLSASHAGLRSGPIAVDVVPGAVRPATLVLLPD